MHNVRRAFAILAAFAIPAILTSGCSSGDKPAETVQVNGNYAGSATAGGQTASMALNATQSGSIVTGTYSIGAPISESGAISGSFLGLVFNMTLTRTSPSAATFTSSLDLSNGSSKLVGSFGNGLYSFNLTKQ